VAGDSTKEGKRKWNRYGSLKTSAQPLVVHLGTNAQPSPYCLLLSSSHTRKIKIKSNKQWEMVVHLDIKCTGKVVHFGKGIE